MPVSSAFAKKDPEEIGVGIIGYSIGKAHANAWNSLRRYYYPAKLNPKLVAISGRTKEKLELEAKRFDIEKTYSDWEKLVRDDEVVVVDNCAPPSIHAQPMILAAELGKDLVCEKPLARNAVEAKAMLEAAEKARVKHLLGYNYRFLPAVNFVREMIQDGTLGEIYYFKTAYLNVNEGYDDPNFPLGWHHDPSIAGYGALGDLGTHALDLARFLIGEVASVSGASETYIKERPVAAGSSMRGKVRVDDITIACMKFKKGALGILEAGWVMAGRTDFLRFEVYGSRGAVRYNLEKINELELYLSSDSKKIAGFRNILVVNKEHPFLRNFWWNQGGGFGWEHTFVNELNHFVNCLADDKSISPQGATFYDGYRNCLIMDGIIESVKSQKWVSIP
jgi:predicted dehydrogenase